MVETEVIQGEGKEVIKREKASKEKIIIWVMSTVVVFTIIILIIIKSQFKGFPLAWVFYISIVLIIVSGVVIGAFYFVKKYKLKEKEDEEKVPHPRDFEFISDLNQKAITNINLMNHIKKFIHGTYDIGKNTIYVFSNSLLYYDDDLGNYAYVVINANYPDRMSIVSGDTSIPALRYIMNKLSSDPEVSPDTEKSVSENLLSGIRTVTERKTHHKKKKPDKEIGDLE